MKEVWKDILGYEGLYQISNLGRIRSLPRKTNNQYCNGLIMKPHNSFGYLKLQLRKNGKYKWFFIHRLVAQAFLNDYSSELQVNHINGIKSDNRICNLEMVTASQNQFHSYHILKNTPSMKNHFGKNHVASVKINQYDLNKKLIKTWDSIIEASQKLDINASCICNNCKNRRKTAGGFIWKYVNK